MARQRKAPEGGGGQAWLNTYADMVTLLLCFFVLIISMSTINEEKFNAFLESFQNIDKEVLEEIIEGLQNGGTHSLLHPCNELSVNAAEQQADDKAEQEAGENEDVAQILKSSDDYISHYSHLLKEL